MQLKDFNLGLKPNYFGLAFDSVPSLDISSHNSQELRLSLNNNGPKDNTPPSPPLILTIGMKNNLDIFYFNVPCMFHTLLDPKGELSSQDFKKFWKQIPDTNELMFDVQNISNEAKSPDGIKKLMKKNNIFYIADRKNDKNQTVIYLTSKNIDGTFFLVEISLPSLKYPNGCSISCRSEKQPLIPLFLQCSQFILTYGL